jgi:ribonucleoside-diphosphate reductase alpha chain
LSKHVVDNKLDEKLFKKTILTAMRMLDNVIDINDYSILPKETKNSNLKHRPVGLGMMGFQDALFKLNIPFNSELALNFTNEITEKYSYYAISGSCQLARERGIYSSYKGSK